MAKKRTPAPEHPPEVQQAIDGYRQAFGHFGDSIPSTELAERAMRWRRFCDESEAERKREAAEREAAEKLKKERRQRIVAMLSRLGFGEDPDLKRELRSFVLHRHPGFTNQQVDERALDFEWLEAELSAAILNETVYFKDGRCFTRGGWTAELGAVESRVIRFLVDRGGSATKDQLDAISTEAVRSLRMLREKHAFFSVNIKLPGAKGRGGYTTTIQPG